jgi:uncharacterized phage protein gp47/JayE
MPLSLDELGLQVRQLAEIQADWRERFIAAYGSGTQVDPETQSNVSKMIAMFADRDAKLDEIIEAIYESSYPSTAAGVSLDRVLEITGATRQGAQPSTLTNTIFAAGTPGTSILNDSLSISVIQTGALFKNTVAFTLGSLGSESITSITRVGAVATVTISGGHSYPADSWVFIEGADQSEYNILAQISNVTATTFDYTVAGTPTTPATGTLIAREATPFSAASVEKGAIQALEGSLTVIETSISGLLRVENSDDAVLGRATETDPEARERRNNSLGALGGGTPEAIKAIVSNVSGVTEVVVFKNDDAFVDVNGVPPHSVEVLVTGGANQDIFDALTGNASQKGAVSGGIRQHGNITGTVVDSSGNTQDSAFSRLAAVRIYVNIVVTTNSDISQGPVFPVDGEAQIIANLAGLQFTGGQDVWKATITNAVTSVAGVITVVPLFNKTTPPTTDTTIVILPTEQANIDSGDITGTIDGSPI